MRTGILAGCLVLFITGCAGVEATAGQGGRRVFGQRSVYAPSPRGSESGAKRVPLGTALVTLSPGERTRQAVELGLLEVDSFEKLLVRAGLEDLDELPPRLNPFTPEDALAVLGRLMSKPVTLGNFPPRMAAAHLLREVLEGGAASREEMVGRVSRFAREQVAVLRPDGYLAWALDGRTKQKVAPVMLKEGGFRALGFELGRFYGGRGSVFRLLDARLREEDGPVLAEMHDDADVISRSLDGAEDAFVELYHALGQALSRPTETVAGLRNLPSGLAALIASSPEYWERFRYMTAGEQMRAVAKLVTNVIATWGTASATTRTVTRAVTGAEAMVPVLSLSAEGTLVMERVLVPVGRTAAVLSGGPGAAIILLREGRAGKGPGPAQGPGKWGPARESMKPRARRYQEQITGHSADEAYWVGGMSSEAGGVKFDGFKDGVLLEAKGPGYAKFIKDGQFRDWFRGADGLLGQAEKQARQSRGVPIQWHVAEPEFASLLREVFEDEGIMSISVIVTPPLP